MKITVKLIGPLIYSAGFSEKEVNFHGPATPENLMASVNIEKTLPTIITRNGKAVTQSDTLKDGDRVVISPLYSGG